MWLLVLIGAGIVALAHTAPAPFLLDAMAGDRPVWHMPRGNPATVYLTFDDGRIQRPRLICSMCWRERTCTPPSFSSIVT